MTDRSNQQTTGRPPGVAADERAARGAGEVRPEGETDATDTVPHGRERAAAAAGDRRGQAYEPGEPPHDPSEGRHDPGERAHDFGERTKEKGREPKTDAEEKARDPRSTARRKMEEAEQAAESIVADGASRAGDRLRSVAVAFLAASDRLDEEGEGRLADYARETASQVDRMSGYLGQGDAGRMVSDLEEKARSNPGMFVGGTLATGFVVGRFLRASRRRDRSSERAGANVPAHAAAEALVPPATPPTPGPPTLPHEHRPATGSSGYGEPAAHPESGVPLDPNPPGGGRHE